MIQFLLTINFFDWIILYTILDVASNLLAIGDAAADGGGVSEAQLAPHPCFHSRVCAQESDDEFDDMPPLVELSSSESEDEMPFIGCRRCQGLSTAGACMHVRACL